MMRTFVIDPVEKTITEAECIPDHDSLAKLGGWEYLDSVKILGHRDHVVFVDDEGRFKENKFFTLEGYPYALAGRGLVYKIGRTGETIQATMTLEQVKALVTFDPADTSCPGVQVYSIDESVLSPEKGGDANPEK